MTPFRVVEVPAFTYIEAADGARLCSLHYKDAAGNHISTELVRRRAELLCIILNRSAKAKQL